MSRTTAVLSAIVAVLVVAVAVVVIVIVRDGAAEKTTSPETGTAAAQDPAEQSPAEAVTSEAGPPEAGQAPAETTAAESERAPAGAVPITATGTGSDGQQTRWIHRSPSGAVSCQIWESSPEKMQCTVESNAGGHVVDIGGPAATIRQVNLGDPKTRPTAPGEPQVVPYGQTVYRGTLYCSSAENGMTCWDSTTGAGAFMAREEVAPVQR